MYWRPEDRGGDAKATGWWAAGCSAVDMVVGRGDGKSGPTTMACGEGPGRRATREERRPGRPEEGVESVGRRGRAKLLGSQGREKKRRRKKKTQRGVRDGEAAQQQNKCSCRARDVDLPVHQRRPLFHVGRGRRGREKRRAAPETAGGGRAGLGEATTDQGGER